MLKNVYTVKQVNAYIKNMFTQDFMREPPNMSPASAAKMADVMGHQCLYQEYVYTGFYAEPAVRQRGSVQL